MCSTSASASLLGAARVDKSTFEPALIAALSRNRTIGRDGDLPWRLPDDLRRFRALTLGHHVIMGRKTFTSLGRPLPGRVNVVVSSTLTSAPPGTQRVASLEQAFALAAAAGDRQPFVIGGAQLYRAALPLVCRMELTLVDADVVGDVHFPAWDEHAWREASRQSHPADARHAHPFAFVTLVRCAA